MAHFRHLTFAILIKVLLAYREILHAAKIRKNSDIFEFVVNLVAKAGIEPATHGFSVRCSTN